MQSLSAAKRGVAQWDTVNAQFNAPVLPPYLPAGFVIALCGRSCSLRRQNANR